MTQPSEYEIESAFSEWLESVCPSGDNEEVQQKWLESSNYLELFEKKVVTVDLRKQAMSREIEPIKNAGNLRIELFKMTQRFSENYCKHVINEFYEKHGGEQ